VRVVDDPTTGSQGRLDACLCLVLGQVQIDVDVVALGSGSVHLLEPDRRSLEVRIHQDVGDLQVAEDGRQEGHHVGDHECVDRDLIRLQAGQVDGETEFAGRCRDLPGERDVFLTQLAGLAHLEPNRDIVRPQVDIQAPARAFGHRGDRLGKRRSLGE
jgi:hypothetical protein